VGGVKRHQGKRTASPEKGDEFGRMLLRDGCTLHCHSAGTLTCCHRWVQGVDSLTQDQALRLVLIPLAMRAIIPPLLTGWLFVTRSASLGIVVAYPELVGMFMQTSLNQIGHAVEIVAMVMGFYMLLSLLIPLLLNAYNRRFRINED
jgi:general L-amino acid transport system permease protein